MAYIDGDITIFPRGSIVHFISIESSLKMSIRGTTRLIGLLGYPVSHSLSPAMHNAALKYHALDYAYVPWGTSPENLETAIAAIRALNLRGANVTLPYKQKVIPFLDEVSPLSLQIGAVNTIVNENGKLIGTTTDTIGFLQNFRTAGQSFVGKSVAILGNGGSARTIAFALLLEDKPTTIYIVARDKEKSQQLAKEIDQKLGYQIRILDFQDYHALKNPCDIVVNATSLGMHPNSTQSPLSSEHLFSGQIVYDIVYTPEKTQLIQYAEAKGLITVGGLGMLVYQGIASFQLWTGKIPDAQLFFESARLQLVQ